MRQEKMIIDGREYPENLEVLKRQEGNMQNNWVIKPAYFLQLVHGLMGSFLAIFKDEEWGYKTPVFTEDKELLYEIWKTLDPRDSKMCENLMYIHKSDPVGYIAQHRYGDKWAEPFRLLRREEYENMLTHDPQPVEWNPGLVGPKMVQTDFLRMIEESRLVTTV